MGLCGRRTPRCRAGFPACQRYGRLKAYPTFHALPSVIHPLSQSKGYFSPLEAQRGFNHLGEELACIEDF